MKINFTFFKKKLLAAVIGCFLFSGKALAQTGILVTYYDGTEQVYAIAPSGKLYFANDNLQVQTTAAATPLGIPVSIIRKVTFTFSVVPLKFTDFTISNEKLQVKLSWKTSNEINTAYFIIERSTDGVNYENIGQVSSLNNGSGGSYNYADLFPKPGIQYYRLKQVDTDGRYLYSKVLTVNRAVAPIISIVPNPTRDYFKITSNTADKLEAKVFSADGKLLTAGNYSPGEQISLNNFTSGLYMVLINNKPYKLIRQ